MSTAAPAPRPLRALVVEDDRRVSAAVAHLLRSDGLDVTGAMGAAAARRHIAREAFDVALIDAQLPDLVTGLLLISDLAPVVPVVATSVDPGLRRPTLAAGARAFAEKDGLPDHLLGLLRRVTASDVLDRP